MRDDLIIFVAAIAVVLFFLLRFAAKNIDIWMDEETQMRFGDQGDPVDAKRIHESEMPSEAKK